MTSDDGNIEPYCEYKTDSEIRAIAIGNGDRSVCKEVTSWIVEGKRELYAPVLFALRRIYKRSGSNAKIGEFAYDTLERIRNDVASPDPFVIGNLFAIVVLHQPGSSSGAARLALPELDQARILFESAMILR